ncbi:hypothetical protein M404DRAFT_118351, partial [Pisolithus tinctorius Marx 270]
QSLSPDSCALILIHRCPACFAGCTFGWPLDKGGDIPVATDGSCPQFYEPTYFIPKAEVDEVGCQIECTCKQPPRQQHITVPDKAIDQCKALYEAANDNKKKAAIDCFDDTGIMALICCHDIPLFFANIDTPDEQQKHSYDILNDDTISHLHFATTAMHACGHEWACQLVFNPHLISGLGLSDGEGMESLWSCFIKLIGIEQALLCQQQIWLIDHHVTAIGLEMQSDLEDWI